MAPHGGPRRHRPDPAPRRRHRGVRGASPGLAPDRLGRSRPTQERDHDGPRTAGVEVPALDVIGLRGTRSRSPCREQRWPAARWWRSGSSGRPCRAAPGLARRRSTDRRGSRAPTSRCRTASSVSHFAVHVSVGGTSIGPMSGSRAALSSTVWEKSTMGASKHHRPDVGREVAALEERADDTGTHRIPEQHDVLGPFVEGVAGRRPRGRSHSVNPYRRSRSGPRGRRRRCDT